MAGTNGKGLRLRLAFLRAERGSYRTGLFTSPYITDFREVPDQRGRDSRNVGAYSWPSDADGGEMAEQGEGYHGIRADPSAGVSVVYEEKCDVVMLEVGLGGRFDATNVIDTPLAAVIMSISLDHTAILGDTVEQIAF